MSKNIQLNYPWIKRFAWFPINSVDGWIWFQSYWTHSLDNVRHPFKMKRNFPAYYRRKIINIDHGDTDGSSADGQISAPNITNYINNNIKSS